MAKSLSQQKKEIRGHLNALRQAAERLQLATPMYKLYADRLAKAKAADMEGWYRAFAKRVGAQIGQDPGEAAFMRGQLHSIESILGLRR